MLIRFLCAAALLAAPITAHAQVRASVATQPVTLEIVASGAVDVVATTVKLSLRFQAEGENRAAAEKALADKDAELRAVLATIDVPPSALSAKEVREVSLDSMVEVVAEAGDADQAQVDSSVTISTSYVLELTSAGRAAEAIEALRKVEVTAEITDTTLDDPAPSRRQAKAKALEAARGDAEAYAAQLGLRVLRIVRISESGDGMLPPTLHTKFGQIFSGGSGMMRALLAPKTGYIHVEEAVSVVFELGK